MSKTYDTPVSDFVKYWSCNFHVLNGEKRDGFAELLSSHPAAVVNRARDMMDFDLMDGQLNARFATLITVRKYLARAQSAIDAEQRPQSTESDCRYCDGDGIFRAVGTNDAKGNWNAWAFASDFEQVTTRIYGCPCNRYVAAGLPFASKADLDRWTELVEPFLIHSGTKLFFRAEECAAAAMMIRSRLTGHPHFARLWQMLGSNGKHYQERVTAWVNQ